MVTVNQWNWRLVVCWGWTSTTNGESKTPNDIVSVDRRSRRQDLSFGLTHMEFHDSQPSKNLQVHRQTKKTPGWFFVQVSLTEENENPTTNTQAGPSRSPGRAPRCQAVAPGHSSLRLEYQNRRSASRACRHEPQGRDTRFFFQPKKRMFTLKKLRHDQQNAKCKMQKNSWEYRPISKRIARKQSNLTLKRTCFFVVHCLILFLARKT